MNEDDSAGAPAANPYAPPEAPVAVRGPAAEVRDLASRGVRLGAKLIDGVIVAVIVALAMWPSLDAAPGADPGSRGVLVLVSVGIGVAVVAGINAWLVYRNGQTIGKKLLGIKIVRGDRSRCGLGRVFFLRWLPFSLVGAIPLVGPLVSLVDSLLIFGDDHRTLHDRLADTVVVTA